MPNVPLIAQTDCVYIKSFSFKQTLKNAQLTRKWHGNTHFQNMKSTLSLHFVSLHFVSHCDWCQVYSPQNEQTKRPFTVTLNEKPNPFTLHLDEISSVVMKCIAVVTTETCPTYSIRLVRLMMMRSRMMMMIIEWGCGW